MRVRQSEKCQRSQNQDKKSSPKAVPGFCMQAYQKNTVTTGPPKNTASFRPKRVTGITAFAANYDRPGFPLAAVYGGGVSKDSRRRFRWLVPPQSVDYDTYLPILVDGLRERPTPYKTCAALALWDLLTLDVTGERVLAALPRIVFPLRNALNVGDADWSCVVRAMKTLQMIATAGKDGQVGLALVPYYRQLLTPINTYRQIEVLSTDGLTLNTAYNLADLCGETLSVLENTGGPCAYSNIKYIIPTYENVASCYRSVVDKNSMAKIVNIIRHTSRVDVMAGSINLRADNANNN